MTIRQGKIKVIPVQTVYKGMQVVHFCTKWEILTISHIDGNVIWFEDKSAALFLEDINTLIVSYINSTFGHIGVENIPLQINQWQSAIDNDEINTTKDIDFEIIIIDESKDNQYFVAKIIPQRKINKDIQKDRLFIQEIINDLERHGYQPGDRNQSKAYQMLIDWSSELKEKSHSTGRTKKLHAEIVGKQNY